MQCVLRPSPSAPPTVRRISCANLCANPAVFAKWPECKLLNSKRSNKKWKEPNRCLLLLFQGGLGLKFSFLCAILWYFTCQR